MDEPDARSLAERVCLLVSSSDNTADVFQQVAPAFSRHWPACKLDRFVGGNSPPATAVDGFTPVLCPQASGWREELAHQVAALPAQYDHVLLFLDDFLILDTVDDKALMRLLAESLAQRLPYLRLWPELRSLAGQAVWRLGAGRATGALVALPADTPYYSALQVTLWQRAHLAALLDHAGSIWDFELQRPAATHYAVAGAPPIRYRHVVERGLWMRDAPWLFRRAGLRFDPGRRAIAPWSQLLRHGWRRAKFAAIGYAWYRRRLARQA